MEKNEGKLTIGAGNKNLVMDILSLTRLLDIQMEILKRQLDL